MTDTYVPPDWCPPGTIPLEGQLVPEQYPVLAAGWGRNRPLPEVSYYQYPGRMVRGVVQAVPTSEIPAGRCFFVVDA